MLVGLKKLTNLKSNCACFLGFKEVRAIELIFLTDAFEAWELAPNE